MESVQKIKEAAPRLWISNQVPKAHFSLSKLTQRVKRILQKMGLEETSVSVVLIGDKEMARLHHRYLGISGPTDVMAFPPSRLKSLWSKKNFFLGEVVVSLETAKKRAQEFGHSWKHELLLYICHGLLHLVGYRDGTGAERKRMEKRQEFLLGWQSKKQKPSF